MRARFSPVRWLGVVLLIIVTPHWGARASEQDHLAAGERAAVAVPSDEEGHVPLHPGDAAKIEDARQLLIQHRYDDALALLNGMTLKFVETPRPRSRTIEGYWAITLD